MSVKRFKCTIDPDTGCCTTCGETSEWLMASGLDFEILEKPEADR